MEKSKDGWVVRWVMDGWIVGEWMDGWVRGWIDGGSSWMDE